MKTNGLCLAALATLALAGCGSKQDVSEKNFAAAIGQYLDQKGELCLGLNKWPVELTTMDLQMAKTITTGTAGQMAALEAVGLAAGADAEVDQIGFMSNQPTGQKLKVKRYTLTAEGKKFYREKEAEQIGLNGSKKIMQGDLCYGKKALANIVKWEGPMKLGDYQEANVKYLYKIDDLADWAKKPEFLAGFPYVGPIIEGANSKEQSHGVKLTSEGWEAKGLN
ncbi:hypothetical protein [Dyella tabacisoli]|uniref:Lipoprotein n=1 Tax=Dyella tabacisoli TaxID=2282381 RepID=A0A369UIX0_9GAMM|nr:hypothetical protein [Dyella tabacisoli]RDD80694.1 hypothetical protein DVJ77_15800 [Dyella tabacisoli]